MHHSVSTNIIYILYYCLVNLYIFNYLYSLETTLKYGGYTETPRSRTLLTTAVTTRTLPLLWQASSRHQASDSLLLPVDTFKVAVPVCGLT